MGPAKRAARRALALDPGAQEARLALAQILEGEGDHRGASEAYRALAENGAPQPEALNGLARNFRMDGMGALARKAWETSLRAGVTAEALTGLARWHLFEPGGQRAEARRLLARALEIDPSHAHAVGLMALDAMASDDHVKALAYAATALEAAPEDADVLAYFCAVLLNTSGLTFSAPLASAFTRALSSGSMDGARLSHVWAALFAQDPELETLRALAKVPSYADFASLFAAAEEEAQGLLCRDFVTLGLAECLVVRPDIERLLTHLRRYCLDKGAGPMPFLAALAQQCFFSEYVFAVEPQEAAQAAALRDAVGRGAERKPASILLAACYGPLAALPNAPALGRALARAGLTDVAHEQVEAVEAERALAARMPSLTPVEDDVSQAVRAQYEESPYPRWRRLTRQGGSYESVGWDAARIFGGWRPQVLVAGCGTGRNGIDMAKEHGALDVLAVDLSRASLAYAQRKAGEMGLTNIRFAQADILGLAKALEGRAFERIECAGVLHHMADPAAGLAALAALLAPSGLMRLGLYSESARAGVVAVRAQVARQGWPTTPEGIRACRAWVQDQARAGESTMRNLAASRDFCSTSSCRDLLFHVQEHRFTIPGLQRLIDGAGLAFHGFTLPNARVRLAYDAAFPDDPARTCLDNWAAFEAKNPGTFSGMYQMYVRHKKEG
jgi:SAM-dependent methyltransferase/Tfp pilus assembly protein PilF